MMAYLAGLLGAKGASSRFTPAPLMIGIVEYDLVCLLGWRNFLITSRPCSTCWYLYSDFRVASPFPTQYFHINKEFGWSTWKSFCMHLNKSTKEARPRARTIEELCQRNSDPRQRKLGEIRAANRGVKTSRLRIQARLVQTLS